MKIIKTEEFITMPAGTIFAPVKDGGIDDEFEIKMDTGDGEHYVGTMPLIPWKDGKYLSEGRYNVDFHVYDGSSADIIAYDLVAVLDDCDVVNLINVLKMALQILHIEEERRTDEQTGAEVQQPQADGEWDNV